MMPSQATELEKILKELRMSVEMLTFSTFSKLEEMVLEIDLVAESPWSIY